MFVNPLAITVGELLDWKHKQAEDTMALITTFDQALDVAYKWARSKPTSMNKGAAIAYIEAMSMAELEGEQMYNSRSKGRAVQILYILSNLQGWRGQEARAVKAMLKTQYAKDK